MHSSAFSEKKVNEKVNRLKVKSKQTNEQVFFPRNTINTASRLCTYLPVSMYHVKLGRREKIKKKNSAISRLVKEFSNGEISRPP